MSIGLDRRNALRSVVGASRYGERVVPLYAWDFALCSCEPSHAMGGIPCIVVAESESGIKGRPYARCLRCGHVWLGRTRRRADRIPQGAVR